MKPIKKAEIFICPNESTFININKVKINIKKATKSAKTFLNIIFFSIFLKEYNIAKEYIIGKKNQ